MTFQVLLDSALKKTATIHPVGQTPEDQVAMMLGLIEFCKEAGADPAVTIDYFNSFLPQGHEKLASVKLAGEKWDAFKGFFNPTAWGSNTPWHASKLIPGVAAGERLQQNLLDPKQSLPENFNAENYPSAMKAMTEQHPTVTKALDGLFQGDQNKTLQTGMQYARGEYGGAMGSVWNGIANHPIVKKWAPYVIPAVATYAAGKMMGMGNLGAGALGVGVGALGGTAYHGIQEHGSLPNFINNGIQKKFFPGSAQPWISQPLDANGLKTEVPDPTVAAHNHAESIGAGAAPKPAAASSWGPMSMTPMLANH